MLHVVFNSTAASQTPSEYVQTVDTLEEEGPGETIGSVEKNGVIGRVQRKVNVRSPMSNRH